MASVKKNIFKSLKYYIVIIIAFVIWITWFDNFSLLNQRQWKEKINKNKTEIKDAQQKLIRYKNINNQLNTNIEEAEFIGRNKYLMKRSNEDVFFFETLENEIDDNMP